MKVCPPIYTVVQVVISNKGVDSTVTVKQVELDRHHLLKQVNDTLHAYYKVRVFACEMSLFKSELLKIHPSSTLRSH